MQRLLLDSAVVRERYSEYMVPLKKTERYDLFYVFRKKNGEGQLARDIYIGVQVTFLEL